jgi:hypothetical protein
LADQHHHKLRRQVEYGILEVFARNPNDRLTGPYDFAGLRALRRDCASDFRLQLRILDSILGNSQTRLRGIQLCLCSLQLLQRLIEHCPGGYPTTKQIPLTSLHFFRLRQSDLRTHNIRFGRTQRVQLVLGIEARHDSAGGHPIANSSQPLDELSIDSKRNIDLVGATIWPVNIPVCEMTRCSALTARTGLIWGAGRGGSSQAPTATAARPSKRTALNRKVHPSAAMHDLTPALLP